MKIRPTSILELDLDLDLVNNLQMAQGPTRKSRESSDAYGLAQSCPLNSVSPAASATGAGRLFQSWTVRKAVDRQRGE